MSISIRKGGLLFYVASQLAFPCVDIYNRLVHSLTSVETELTSNHEVQQWNSWARNLQKWGLAGLVSAILEGSAGFATLAAQSLYISEPVLETWLPVNRLAKMLENPDQVQAFIEILRDEAQ